MTYAEVFEEAVRRWRSNGGIAAAIGYVEAQIATTSHGDERGRLLSLSAEFLLRQEDWQQAGMKLSEALGLVTSPEYEAQTLCISLEYCTNTHRVEEGLRHSRRLETLLSSHHSNVAVDQWRPRHHHNVGRLLVVAGDYPAAIPHLEAGRAGFHAAGQTAEALMAGVSLAAALCRVGHLAEAETLCNEALTHADSDYILIEANLVLERVLALQGDYREAERLLDRASEIQARRVGKQDYRLFLEILEATAELLELRGDGVAAGLLRKQIQRQAAVGRVALGLGVKNE